MNGTLSPYGRCRQWGDRSALLKLGGESWSVAGLFECMLGVLDNSLNVIDP